MGLSRFLMEITEAGSSAGPLETCAQLLFLTLLVNISFFLWLPNNSITLLLQLGITVTKELSGTTRAVLDQIRIILITIVFTLPLGAYLCRLQQFFHFTMVHKIKEDGTKNKIFSFQPIGLVTLIIGVFVYNDVIIMPLIRWVYIVFIKISYLCFKEISSQGERREE